MGQGATNTINRAELAAIAVAIEEMGFEADETLASDSQVSLYLISKYLDNPQDLQLCKHKVLLEEIADKLLQRAARGYYTTLIKVKSHIGIIGNEEADKLAFLAAKQDYCDIKLTRGNEGLQGVYWPCIKQASDQDGEATFKLSNLQGAIKTAAGPKCQTGLTNRTQYVQFWEGIESVMLPQGNKTLWSLIPMNALRNVLKSRFGQTWNKGMAYIRKMPYIGHEGIARNNLCPLCNHPDSCSHIFGGCKHADMTKNYIARHNAAGKMILKAIKDGSCGNQYMIADLGTKDAMAEHGADGSRLPGFLARPQTIQKLNETSAEGCEWQQMDPADRLKLRPDVMLVDMLASEAEDLEQASHRPSVKRSRQGIETVINRTHAPQKKCTVKIVDIGYCSDTRYHEKLTEKRLQHRRLCNILEQEGHKVEFLPIILGTYALFSNVCQKHSPLAG